MLMLALAFACTFLILNATGWITSEKIELWLKLAQDTSPIWISAIVAALLFADLFIAVPTLTVIILAGFFLGPVLGAVAAIIGLSLAGIGGYGLSRRYGHYMLNLLIKQPDKRQELKETFQKHGTIVILLARAVPILPEVSACMAGLTGMAFAKFLLIWWVSAIPYAVAASYAGSISTLENPKPAIFMAMGITLLLWISWIIFNKFIRK